MVDENPVEDLQKEFQDVLMELQGEKNLQKFHVEYEKLLASLKKAHEVEKRLMTKCRELKAELNVISVNYQSTVLQSQDDKSTIVSLKQVQYEGKRIRYENAVHYLPRKNKLRLRC